MFKDELDAEKAVKDLNNRWFGERPIMAELSPVTDFREACCRQYEQSECTRGGFCNFMHIKPVSKSLSNLIGGVFSHRPPLPLIRSPPPSLPFHSSLSFLCSYTLLLACVIQPEYQPPTSRCKTDAMQLFLAHMV